jgi:hypothetical protein
MGFVIKVGGILPRLNGEWRSGFITSLIWRPPNGFKGIGMNSEGSGVSVFAWLHPIQQVPAGRS